METPEFCFALREDLADTGNLFLPTQAEPLATGWDVRAAQPSRENIVIKSGFYFKIPLGFRSYCPPGWYYELHPRSSSFTKKYMHSLIGIIDESWEGETQFAGVYCPDETLLCKNELIIKFGDPIAQLIPRKKVKACMKSISNKDIEQVYKNRNSSRKDGGFGSTG